MARNQLDQKEKDEDVVRETDTRKNLTEYFIRQGLDKEWRVQSKMIFLGEIKKTRGTKSYQEMEKTGKEREERLQRQGMNVCQTE